MPAEVALNAGTVYAKLKLYDNEFLQPLARANAAFADAQRRWERGFGAVERAVDGAATKMLMIGGAGIVAAGGLIKLGAQMEQTEMAFTTLLGSAEAATKMLGELRAFAQKSPFNFLGLTESTRRLLAMGFAARDVIPMLTDIGDGVSALGGGKEMIDRVTLALGQMQAKGRVMTQEINQLTETGIPALEYLATAAGVSKSEFLDMVQKGLIPADQAIQAIRAGLRNDFGGMMAKQAETAAGQLSNLRDQAEKVGVEFGTALLPAFKEALRIAQSFTNALDGLTDGQKQSIAQWVLYGSVTMVALGALQKMALAAKPLILWINGIAAAHAIAAKAADAHAAAEARAAMASAAPKIGKAAALGILNDNIKNLHNAAYTLGGQSLEYARNNEVNAAGPRENREEFARLNKLYNDAAAKTRQAEESLAAAKKAGTKAIIEQAREVQKATGITAAATVATNAGTAATKGAAAAAATGAAATEKAAVAAGAWGRVLGFVTNPYVLAAAVAVAGLTIAISAIVREYRKAENAARDVAKTTTDAATAKRELADELTGLGKRYDELAGKPTRTAEEEAELQRVQGLLRDDIAMLGGDVDTIVAKFGGWSGAARALASDLDLVATRTARTNKAVDAMLKVEAAQKRLLDVRTSVHPSTADWTARLTMMGVPAERARVLVNHASGNLSGALVKATREEDQLTWDAYQAQRRVMLNEAENAVTAARREYERLTSTPDKPAPLPRIVPTPPKPKKARSPRASTSTAAQQLSVEQEVEQELQAIQRKWQARVPGFNGAEAVTQLYTSALNRLAEAKLPNEEFTRRAEPFRRALRAMAGRVSTTPEMSFDEAYPFFGLESSSGPMTFPGMATPEETQATDARDIADAQERTRTNLDAENDAREQQQRLLLDSAELQDQIAEQQAEQLGTLAALTQYARERVDATESSYQSARAAAQLAPDDLEAQNALYRATLARGTAQYRLNDLVNREGTMRADHQRAQAEMDRAKLESIGNATALLDMARRRRDAADDAVAVAQRAHELSGQSVETEGKLLDAKRAAADAARDVLTMERRHTDELMTQLGLSDDAPAAFRAFAMAAAYSRGDNTGAAMPKAPFSPTPTITLPENVPVIDPAADREKARERYGALGDAIWNYPRDRKSISSYFGNAFQQVAAKRFQTFWEDMVRKGGAIDNLMTDKNGQPVGVLGRVATWWNTKTDPRNPNSMTKGQAAGTALSGLFSLGQIDTTDTLQGAIAGAGGGFSLASGGAALFGKALTPALGIAGVALGALVGTIGAQQKRDEMMKKIQQAQLEELRKISNILRPVSDFFNRGAFGAVSSGLAYGAGAPVEYGWAVEQRRGRY